MGTRTSYPPGTFSWVDLATPDAAPAKAFYTRLFGWEAEDTDAGGGAVYTICRLDGFEVGDAGRMAVLADPQGAVLGVWQPRARIGAERVNDVGCLCMNELATTDLDGARAFYEGLFGWSMALEDTGPDGPVMGFARNGDAINASFFPAEEGLPAHWRPCFTVESTEAALVRVRELGGTEYLEPLELPDGSIAMVRDPQGARFTLFAGETDP